MDYINAVGRRKSSVARVFIKSGSGNIVVNKRPYNDYFALEFHQLALTEPLRILEAEGQYDIKINVRGGGIKGQAEAARLGLARALVKEAAEQGRTVEAERDGIEIELNEVKMKLKEANKDIMTRDARKVERKKPGFRKARKVSQFSKR